MKHTIHKILNNNVIITLNEQNQEMILMGRGIGFKKNIGDNYDPLLTEKRFKISDENNGSTNDNTAVNIPIEILATTEKIIEYVTAQVTCKLDDHLYLQLADHIQVAIMRFKQGLTIPNSFNWEMKKIYPKEYELGLYALTIIKQRLGITLPSDEAGLITFHIINAEQNRSISKLVNLIKITQQILDMIKDYFNLDYNEDSPYYQRFIIHLKFFAIRIINNNLILNGIDFPYSLMKQQYQHAFQCTENIATFLLNHYQYQLTEEEKLFLTIYIERIRTDLIEQ
ncbi:BglG family transcription antiterminator LicT [Candidatus Schmidhempelia bombi]|uniref:PRD domain-containing protein n=1 Tax=Candidatus Schmidhempelia bombi str. Bimp TaxID=1387197 RepID=A0AB94IBR0_9GAMM|nr:PRD domain-containing protein [Candidatus Schmidhempelia bombi]TEA26842.1 PRD domain-containing protein [Candidatus Schmidhempelia bombi str. Bimp]